MATLKIVFALPWLVLACACAHGAQGEDPKPDCKARVGYDRYAELPGYFVGGSGSGKVCVPILVTAELPPAHYKGKDFYVEEFTDAKLKSRWHACKADVACNERLKPQIARWVPPKARSVGSNLEQIRRPGFFASAPYYESIAEAESRAYTVEFTAPRDAFERLKLDLRDLIKLRGWYLEGTGVDDGRGGKVRALIVMSNGGGGEMTSAEHVGQRPWRQLLHDLNRAGFDVLAYDRRGEGISGGLSSTNTLEQSEDIYRALEQLETGSGLRILTPQGQVLEGSAAAGRLLAGRKASEIPTVLGGYSRGAMATGWAMHGNFVESCSYDLPNVACRPAKGYRNIKGAIFLAPFGSGAGYRPASPDLDDRNLLLGAMAADYNIVFYPSSALLAGMDKWPAAFFGKGLWDRAESVEGTIAAYKRIRGLREIVVVREAHALDAWGPQSQRYMSRRIVNFAQAVIAGKTEIEGERKWSNLEELVSTSSGS